MSSANSYSLEESKICRLGKGSLFTKWQILDLVLETGRKKLWEKQKLLVMSNFFFSHSVFEGLVLQTRKNQFLFGKGLTGSLLSYGSFCLICIFCRILELLLTYTYLF